MSFNELLLPLQLAFDTVAVISKESLKHPNCEFALITFYIENSSTALFM